MSVQEKIVLHGGETTVTLTAEKNNVAVEVRNKALDYAPQAVPLVELQVHHRAVERHERTRDFVIERMVHEPELEQGAHIVLRSNMYSIVFGIWVTVSDEGELVLTAAPHEVEEHEIERIRITAMRWLPGLMHAPSDGVILMPITTGVLTRPADKPELEDRFLIYGEQDRWELLTTLPISGVHSPRGGFMALATGCPHDMYCHVRTDGQGEGSIELYPMFRREWVDPVDWALRVVRIAPVPAKADLVNTVAHRLRRHVLEDLGKKTLTQRAEESGQCAYQQSAYTMKLFHGVQKFGAFSYVDSGEKGNRGKYVRNLTFPSAAKQMQRLKDAGVDRIYFQSVGWNPRGHDGAYPTIFPIDLRLGGEAGLRRMIQTAKDLGYQITTHMNVGESVPESPDFEPHRLLHDIWGETKVTGVWAGGYNRRFWPNGRSDAELRGVYEGIQNLGFNGMMYLDGMANPLYLNYHPKHGGTRRQYAEGISNYMKVAQQVCGAAGTELIYLYVIEHADSSSAGGGDAWHFKHFLPEWPVSRLIDEPVPLWEMALHDLITRENKGLDWSQTMKGVLLGQVPRDEWSTEPGAMPLLDDDRIVRIKARYDILCDQFSHLVPQQITQWQRPSEGVEQSTFADGTEVVADFNEGRLTVNGKAIEQPAALGGSGK